MEKRESFYTNEERQKPYWYGGEHFQINTSTDPKYLGIHVSPFGSGESYKRLDLLLNDVAMFFMDWTRQNPHRMNGFMGGRYGWTFHVAGWEPHMGYDKHTVDLGIDLTHLTDTVGSI